MFLADRRPTNGCATSRAYATVLRSYVVFCSDVRYVLGLNGAS